MPVLKTGVAQATVGSNPTLSAKQKRTPHRLVKGSFSCLFGSSKEYADDASSFFWCPRFVFDFLQIVRFGVEKLEDPFLIAINIFFLTISKNFQPADV